MNIGALQSMIGMNQLAVNNVQKGDPATTKFGAIFASISTNAPETELAGTGEIPVELISNLFNATTVEELEIAIQAIPGSGNTELPSSVVATENIESVEDLANLLDVNPEEVLVKVKQLLEQAGLTKIETDELTVATDMWTILSMIDGVGSRFINELNGALQKPATRNEAIELLAFLKTVDVMATKKDMVVSMEQIVDSFHHMLTGAAGQFEQRIVAMMKQEQLPFIQQKTDFRIVLETNSSNSTNAESNGNKQPDTPSQTTAAHGITTAVKVEVPIHQTESRPTNVSISNNADKQPDITSHTTVVHGTSTSVKVELPIQQSESNHTNRSETFMKEMQALMKRSNFGQVGGTNRMLIKLYPEHLGQVRIELLETNGIMTARILASTAFAKGLLDSQLHQLKHAFNQQNLQINRIDITQTIQESTRNEREQSFNEQFKREQHNSDNRQDKTSEEDQSFEEYMIELEV
ncbi:flagellar hook-length control protein FliK [Sporosarcina sp. SAFN-015]|uniref:flagellar hook-length control protein FliK n=1 Tax=Sporosarcina sp. SAFN-015 TaxID=3387274 RepID=UPI003F7F6144